MAWKKSDGGSRTLCTDARPALLHHERWRLERLLGHALAARLHIHAAANRTVVFAHVTPNFIKLAPNAVKARIQFLVVVDGTVLHV